jgi:hypothetical protein
MAEVEQLNMLCDRIEGLAVPSPGSEGSPLEEQTSGQRTFPSQHQNHITSPSWPLRG